MEDVGVWRGSAETDVYGNPVQGTPVLVSTQSALVAPSHPEEAVAVGSVSVITGYVVYIPGADVVDVQATDLLEVRGQKLPIDGKPAVWKSYGGVQRGLQVSVRVVDAHG
jgi:hypothetical protein